jgi:hypothetical protein
MNSIKNTLYNKFLKNEKNITSKCQMKIILNKKSAPLFKNYDLLYIKNDTAYYKTQ